MNDKIIIPYNICFLGRTGNGKSSLINSLFGTALMTDPLIPCTKILSTSTILTTEVTGFNAISAYDTPGIGEFSESEPYQLYYQYAVSKANCIVLVTTLDRTDAPAQRLLMSLKTFIDERRKPKFIIALNHIDSRVTVNCKDDQVWDDLSNSPTELRMNQISERQQIIKDKYSDKFLPFEVVPVCALRGYGIDVLKSKILK